MEATEPDVVVEPCQQLAAPIGETVEAVSTLTDEDLLVVSGGPWIVNP